MRARTGHFMAPSLVGSQFAALEVTSDLLRVRGDREPEAVLAEILSLLSALNSPIPPSP
jgi:gluconate kinase